ncbi:hypothetical protein [Bradyrhizobium liaoningense]|uniref:hypothetical protein n=1 Tax=Bradyrhizobium liaoningense TaxID=43992 RepID=UPI001BA9A3A7|nr:hypothetical protein [Bradyrhizobium liaoningense]MBR1168497.1 hypothetical protein [Bradyrhizobium liaoningense]
MAEGHSSEESERGIRLIITYVRQERDRYQSAVNHAFITLAIAGIVFATLWIRTVQHLARDYAAARLGAPGSSELDLAISCLAVMAIGVAAAGMYVLVSIYSKFYQKITESHLSITRTILGEVFGGQDPSDLGEGIR